MRKIIDSTVPLSPEAPRRGPAEPRAQIQPDGRPRPLAPYLSWGKGGRPLAGPSGYLGKRLLTAGRSAGFAIQPVSKRQAGTILSPAFNTEKKRCQCVL